MTPHPFQHWMTALGVMTARPGAFLVLAVYVAAWLVFDRQSFDWHAVATMATWFMTLVIQRAEHRDTQALHAKLDELLRTSDKASSELTRLDAEEPEEIEEHRARAAAQDP